MKAALAVNTVFPSVARTLDSIVRLSSCAADHAASLILFPEAALTGLQNNNDPSHDLPLGQPIPGPLTAFLGQLAQHCNLWLAIGMLERDGQRLFDSSLLFSPGAEIAFKYRRVSYGWLSPNADLAVYGLGEELLRAETPLGSLAFLICGDLFDKSLIHRVQTLAPKYLLAPIARDRYYEGPVSPARTREWWKRDIVPEYIAQVRKIGITTLIVNQITDAEIHDNECFGGALAVGSDGTLLGQLPALEEDILFLDLDWEEGS